MKKNTLTYSTIFNYVCVVLMLLLLVAQFLPFWSCASCETGSCSVADYVWFPGHHKDITKGIMREIYGKKFEVAQVILPHIVILVSSILGIIFCLKNAKQPIFALLPLLAGLAGTFGYLMIPGLQAGQNWILHLIASALLLVCSLVALSGAVLKMVNKLKASN